MSVGPTTTPTSSTLHSDQAEGDGNSQSTASNWFKANTKPILRDTTTPLPPPPNFSPEARPRLRNGTLNLDPYPMLVKSLRFQSCLPMVVASTTFEAIDGDGSADTICKTPNMHCLWDTGAHCPTITDDMLPPSFLQKIQSDEYIAIYGAGSGHPSIQIALCLQFSNVNFILEGIAIVRPAGSLPNDFSGMILGQHSLLQLIEYYVVPAKVLAAKGIDAQNS
ncbi:hypothetical protein AJ78_00312 [Emergomyces pasteurianus Ep9510]|uniref:Uncharacterized protein n=1 Tax=Emergomyces pasteurianus Ep9510 TaxID=1447872 RepID=A0A1J9QHZ2_9EURO|nr:hypothetical protein AJ78_00312 [Emergomyces pasteurianus Ep9510]